MNINDEIILLITKTPKDYFKKKDINLTSFNPNIKIFKKNDAFIEINVSDFINKCKKYLIEVLDYGITSIEDKDNIKLSISKGGLIVQDFSSSGSYEQSIIDALQWHLDSLKDIKKGA